MPVTTAARSTRPSQKSEIVSIKLKLPARLKFEAGIMFESIDGLDIATAILIDKKWKLQTERKTKANINKDDAALDACDELYLQLRQWQDDYPADRKRLQEVIAVVFEKALAIDPTWVIPQFPETQDAAEAKESAVDRPLPEAELLELNPFLGSLDRPLPFDQALTVPIGSIVPSPDNPRELFDEAKLAELATSLQQHKQQQPITVFINLNKQLEIIDGERRYQASLLAKLPTVSIIIRDVTLAEACELRGVANLKREDLTAIEEAKWYQQMFDRCGYSQRQLAEKLGVSQGHISNRVRLLNLPDDWQQRLITGEITPTMARDLAPWADVPAVLELMGKELEDNEEVVSFPEEWKAALQYVVGEASRPLNGHWYDRSKFQSVKVLLTKKQLQDPELDIRECPQLGSGGTAPRRAFNVTLWEQYQAAGEARRDKRATKSTANNKTASKLGDSTPTMTAAQKRDQAQQRKEQWQKKLYRYKIAWLRDRIVERLTSDRDLPVDREALLLKLLLHFACHTESSHRWEALKEVIESHDGKLKLCKQHYQRLPDVMATLATVPMDRMSSVAWSLLTVWLQSPFEGYRAHLSAADIEHIAAEIGVSVERHWNLERAFLELCTRNQLLNFAKEWGYRVDATKRTELIDQIMELGAGYYCPPKELVNISGVQL